ncbi:hypothetical protein GCM10009710_30270 [Aeromicrobium alkaliterrae]|uniref:histidine kinase n=1 Tax=Aeromicrobium alkaliterrae TaxID=302168 RepID=A0ABN2K4F9_9ACTN
MYAVGIIGLDRNGVVRQWNRGAELIKGYTAEEVLGTSFERFYREVDRELGLPELLLRTAEREDHVENSGWRVRADGSLFWADVVIMARRGADGEVDGYMKIVRDESAEHAAAEDHRAFLEAMAHDLVSPLASLRWTLEGMEAGTVTGQQIAQVEASVEHLLTMVDDLRTHVKNSFVDQLVLPLQDYNLRDGVAVAVNVVGHGEALRRVEIIEPTSVVAQAHPPTLIRALANLLDNALRYSNGPVQVEVARDPVPTVLVRDTGRGIDPADLAAIFEPRRRGRFAVEGDGGSGLGLSSARRLLQRQGGRVDLRSELGVGTEATVLLRPAVGT